MNHIWKNGSRLKTCVTVEKNESHLKMCHTWENGSQLKNVSQLEKWVTFKKCGSWKSRSKCFTVKKISPGHS